MISKTGHDAAVDCWSLGILIFEMAAGRCPFMAEDQAKTCQNILSGKIDFPNHFSPELCQIINVLLQKDPTKRLGCVDYGNRNEVRNHQWFMGFDWSALFQHKLKAPHISRLVENENLSTNNQTKIKVSWKINCCGLA